MSDWSKQARKVFGEVAEEIAEKAVRKVALSSFSTLVKTTPVDTGRARSAWMMTRDTPTTEEPPEGRSRYPAPDAVPGASKGAKLGDTLFIANNVAYIGHLDDGTSRQAPGGMTAVMIAQLEAQFGVRG